MNDIDTCCSSECCSARADDTRKGRRLEYFTLGWNLLEGGIAVVAGIVANSIALVGFGADSLIECLSGGILLWRLQLHVDDERRERIALKLVGVSFLLLAAYVAFDAAKTLFLREEPLVSIVGIVLSCAALIVMPLLARAKRKVATSLESRSLEADSRQTDLCAYLSAILLGGLVLNALLGWWWADPIAGVIMVPIITREGIETLRGNGCTDCH
ncbi:MAG: cation diffusion facilitator family transporter [Desulfomonilaceae bacterium]